MEYSGEKKRSLTIFMFPESSTHELTNPSQAWKDLNCLGTSITFLSTRE